MRLNLLKTRAYYIPILAVIALVASLVGIQCMNTGVADTDVPSATSLLLVAPYVGDETEIRDPAPETERLEVGDESIEGWVAPPEKVFRFPVELGSNAYLSFMFCARTTEAAEKEDISIRVEFVRDGAMSGRLVYPTNRRHDPDFRNRWIHVNVPIGASGKGELKLMVDGPLAENPDAIKFWGQPAVYHPDQRYGRNVLLIGVDTMRRDSCTPFDGRPEIMPSLDVISEECTLFTHTWSQAPWTLPSFASMITGRYPSPIGATGYNERLPLSAKTVGEIVREYGYATETVCGNPWLGNPNSGFHQGMDGLWYQRNSRGHESIAKAKEFMRRAEDRDWFCFLHFQDPHTSYEPLAQYADRLCDPSYEGQYKYEFMDESKWRSDGFTPDEDDLGQVRGLYDAECAFVDFSLRQLFAWMDENGFLENTLVIFAGDHGEEFFEHGSFGHGQNHYEELVRMPLIVKGPGFPEGGEIDVPTGNMDIVPTILEYLEIPLPEDLPGVPLQDIISGEYSETRVIYGEECNADSVKFGVEWPYKCILNFSTGETQLYDLEDDPGETTDISDGEPELVERLSRGIVLNMIPRNHAFFLAVIGNPDDEPVRFTGTLEIPDGIRAVREYAFQDGDSFTVRGNTISFDIAGTINDEKKEKVLVIFPSHGSYECEANVMVNGRTPGDRFYPHGTSVPEPSGMASIDIAEFPWPAGVPGGYLQGRSACYLIGTPGMDPSEEEMEGRALDATALEQLRALGYLGY